LRKIGNSAPDFARRRYSPSQGRWALLDWFCEAGVRGPGHPFPRHDDIAEHHVDAVIPDFVERGLGIRNAFDGPNSSRSSALEDVLME
jgi:hypothetical protein